MYECCPRSMGLLHFNYYYFIYFSFFFGGGGGGAPPLLLNSKAMGKPIKWRQRPDMTIAVDWDV